MGRPGGQTPLLLARTQEGRLWKVGGRGRVSLGPWTKGVLARGPVCRSRPPQVSQKRGRSSEAWIWSSTAPGARTGLGAPSSHSADEQGEAEAGAARREARRALGGRGDPGRAAGQGPGSSLQDALPAAPRPLLPVRPARPRPGGQGGLGVRVARPGHSRRPRLRPGSGLGPSARRRERLPGNAFASPNLARSPGSRGPGAGPIGFQGLSAGGVAEARFQPMGLLPSVPRREGRAPIKGTVSPRLTSGPRALPGSRDPGSP